MVSEAPPFWWMEPDWRAWSLAPLSFLYGRIAGYRMGRKRRHAPPVPVICVGNFTVGGAGKTPTALTIARAAKAKGLKPGFLSRGYGGSLDVTTVVDPECHRAVDVGDEPLLLAREALTVISRRRVAGAERLVKEGVDLIIMDDGFQSARLAVDFALVVIDTGRGVGNGHIVPGGPVRAPIAVQMRHLDAILKVGDGNAADRLVRQAARAGKQVMVAKLRPPSDAGLAGRRVLAFAGIADPGKFYRTLEAIGAEIAATRDFPDHHHLSDDEIDDLIAHADAGGLILATTAKDMVRLIGGHGRSEELRRRVSVVDVEMAFDDPQAPGFIIERAIEACRARRLKGPAR
ncbi:MAG: tetraacyldisaccharide 4'-kinase [Rhizobium sp.]|nr:tetraacyldisaccharide 4'-kinase [Rhizobium sp.]